MLFMELWEILD